MAKKLRVYVGPTHPHRLKTRTDYAVIITASEEGDVVAWQ